MAKKSTMSKAADEIRTVAGTALGAATAAAAGAVVKTVAEAVQEGGAKLDGAAPALREVGCRCGFEAHIAIPEEKSGES